jgi:hypothetical protein
LIVLLLLFIKALRTPRTSTPAIFISNSVVHSTRRGVFVFYEEGNQIGSRRLPLPVGASAAQSKQEIHMTFGEVLILIFVIWLLFG